MAIVIIATSPAEFDIAWLCACDFQRGRVKCRESVGGVRSGHGFPIKLICQGLNVGVHCGDFRHGHPDGLLSPVSGIVRALKGERAGELHVQ